MTYVTEICIVTRSRRPLYCSKGFLGIRIERTPPIPMAMQGDPGKTTVMSLRCKHSKHPSSKLDFGDCSNGELPENAAKYEHGIKCPYACAQTAG